MRRIVIGAGALLSGVGLMAGCSATAKEPVGPANPTATSASPTSTPAPSASTGVVQDLSDPALGIVFGAAPELTGDGADVYNWIATFEKEYWRTMTTNKVSPAFAVMTSAEVQARMQQVVSDNVDVKATIGGVFHVTIADVSVDGDTARATTCDDYRAATFTDFDGPDTPESAGFGENLPLEATLVRGNADGQWLIQSESRIGTC